jgi:hypothetical protein
MSRIKRIVATVLTTLALAGATAGTASAATTTPSTPAASHVVTPYWNNVTVSRNLGSGTVYMQATGTFGWDGINVWYNKNSGGTITARFHWVDNQGRAGWDYGWFNESSGQSRSFWWGYGWPAGSCVTGYMLVSGQGDFWIGQICA